MAEAKGRAQFRCSSPVTARGGCGGLGAAARWGETACPFVAALGVARATDPCGKEGEGVLVGAFQSEREEETRDRAERGSAVRGSDQASVAAEGNPLRPTDYDPNELSAES